jgi:hypothetical protein
VKTLIIHPKDTSTVFLEPIYEKIDNETIIQKNYSKQEIVDLIESHDRIMMMGHGSSEGLFSIGNFESDNGYVIDKSFVPFLKKKKECFYLWCNADKFVEKYQLNGFYSGMFISEVHEASFCDVDTNQSLVDQSNYSFSKIVSKWTKSNMKNLYENVKMEYSKLAEFNDVALYNLKRLYYQDSVNSI